MSDVGFAYFPLQGSNSPDFSSAKKPRFSFLERSFTDAEVTEKWREAVGMLGLRTGVVNGKNLVVVDIDERKGGEISALTLNFPLAPEVITPHGRHLYFRAPMDCPIQNDNAGKIGKGIDVRGEHGYVVAAGSKYQDKEYKKSGYWPETFEEFPMLPEIVVTKLLKKERSAEAPIIVETKENIDDCILMVQTYPLLLDTARSDQVYHIVCAVKDRGLTLETALPLLLEHLPSELAEIGKKRIEETVQNAYKYGKNAIGCHAPITVETLFAQENFNLEQQEKKTTETGGVSEDTSQTTKEERKSGTLGLVEETDELSKKHNIMVKAAARWELKCAAQTEEPKELEYLVDGVIPQGGLTFLYGAPGAGKSFIAVDFAHRVATGISWCGRRAKKSGVLYIAAESRLCFPNRLTAARMRPGADIPAENLLYHANPVTLNPRHHDFATLTAHLILNPNIKLVVVDTLSRSLGGDENNNELTAEYLNAMQRIINETGVTILFVHHTGKDFLRGMRGSSNFTTFPEVILCTVPVYGEGKDAQVIGHVLRCEKHSEGERMPDHSYELQVVTLGQGKFAPIKSCYVEFLLDNTAYRAAQEKMAEAAIVENEDIDSLLAW